MGKAEQNAKARLTKLFPGKFDVKNLRWVGYGKPFTVACKKHGDFETTSALVKYHFNKKESPCPHCNSRIVFDEAVVTEEINSRIWSQFLRVQKITFEDGKHGDRFYSVTMSCICSHVFTRPLRVVRGKAFRGCPKCNRQRPKVKDNPTFLAKVREFGNPNLIFPGLDWKSSSDTISSYCMKHRVRLKAKHPAYIKELVCPGCTEEQRAIRQEEHRKLKELNLAKAKSQKVIINE